MPIKILIGKVPRLLLDIVNQLVLTDPSVEVLATDIPEADLPTRVAIDRPDVVIVACHAGNAARLARSVFSHARPVKVVALTGQGRDAVLFEAETRQLALGDVSPSALRRAIGSTHQIGSDHTRSN